MSFTFLHCPRYSRPHISDNHYSYLSVQPNSYVLEHLNKAPKEEGLALSFIPYAQYCGPLALTAPMATRLLETFTFTISTLLCLNIGTPRNHVWTNGKLMVLGVPILMYIKVTRNIFFSDVILVNFLDIDNFRKSCIMGWRLFAIIAAYCDCSEAFRPYLFKYLETTASDTMRTYSGAAAICLQNLRKTFKYGGRKNVPLKEEIAALAVSNSNIKKYVQTGR